MAFSSLDDLVNKMSNGQTTGQVVFNKLVPAAHTAGRWYDFSALAGTPIANAWAGTALNWRTCDETTGNGETAKEADVTGIAEFVKDDDKDKDKSSLLGGLLSRFGAKHPPQNVPAIEPMPEPIQTIKIGPSAIFGRALSTTR